MLIETDPCQYCDFTPAVCSGDIENCMIYKELARPVYEEDYEREKLKRYKRLERPPMPSASVLLEMARKGIVKHGMRDNF